MIRPLHKLLTPISPSMLINGIALLLIMNIAEVRNRFLSPWSLAERIKYGAVSQQHLDRLYQEEGIDLVRPDPEPRASFLWYWLRVEENRFLVEDVTRAASNDDRYFVGSNAALWKPALLHYLEGIVMAAFFDIKFRKETKPAP